jgi:hypothetical protein
MLLFLAGIVDQLDLALEHIGKGDAHNARFGLMMTDNALELVLHQTVKDKRSEAASWRYRETPYPHGSKLRKAYLGSFTDKLDFAKVDAAMSAEQARTFNIMHDFRNEVYHAGLAHEAVLLGLARFYLAEACTYIGTFNSGGIGWGSSQVMPDRAKKYFAGTQWIPGTAEDFPLACKAIAHASEHDVGDLIAALADDFERIVEDTDLYLNIVAGGVYVGQQTTRDEAVLKTQAWEALFDDEGPNFLRKRRFRGNTLEAIKVLEAEYPFPIRKDPIPGWRASTRKLRASGDGHAALDRYYSWIKMTGPFRASIEQSAAAAEAEIEAASDRMRGK